MIIFKYKNTFEGFTFRGGRYVEVALTSNPSDRPTTLRKAMMVYLQNQSVKEQKG
jgi:hypothetical protein